MYICASLAGLVLPAANGFYTEVEHKERLIIMFRRLISAFATCALIFSCTMGMALAAEDDSVVASINEHLITKDDFYGQMELLYGEKILTQLIADKLIEIAAEERGIVIPDEDVETQFEGIRSQYSSQTEFVQALWANNYTEASLKYYIKQAFILDFLAYENVIVTDEEVFAYFQDNKDSLGTPAQNRVSHILVTTKELADSIYSQLQAGADFAALAKEHSIDTASAVQGGDIGYISDKEVLIPGFREAMDMLAFGQISPPVKTEFGYHIIKITERTLAKPAELASQIYNIRSILAEQKARSYDEVVQDLYNEYKVSIKWDRYQHLGNI